MEDREEAFGLDPAPASSILSSRPSILDPRSSIFSSGLLGVLCASVVSPSLHPTTMATIQRIQVIASHTGGEPTRVVIAGGPDLGRGSMAERRARFREHFDEYRSAVVNEPRGSDVLVGAILCEPVDPGCAAG